MGEGQLVDSQSKGEEGRVEKGEDPVGDSDRRDFLGDSVESVQGVAEPEEVAGLAHSQLRRQTRLDVVDQAWPEARVVDAGQFGENERVELGELGVGAVEKVEAAGADGVPGPGG